MSVSNHVFSKGDEFDKSEKIPWTLDNWLEIIVDEDRLCNCLIPESNAGSAKEFNFWKIFRNHLIFDMFIVEVS